MATSLLICIIEGRELLKGRGTFSRRAASVTVAWVGVGVGIEVEGEVEVEDEG